MVDSGLAAALTILFRPRAGQRDDQDVRQPRLAPQPPRHFEAIDAGHVKVEKNDVRSQLARSTERLLAIIGNVHMMAQLPKQEGERVCRIAILVDDENPAVMGSAFQASAYFGACILYASPPWRNSGLP